MAVLDTAIARGEAVTLNVLGGSEVIERAARPDRNSKTGEAIGIAATKTIKFKPAKPVRDTFNPSVSGDSV